MRPQFLMDLWLMLDLLIFSNSWVQRTAFTVLLLSLSHSSFKKIQPLRNLRNLRKVFFLKKNILKFSNVSRSFMTFSNGTKGVGREDETG